MLSIGKSRAKIYVEDTKTRSPMWRA